MKKRWCYDTAMMEAVLNTLLRHGAVMRESMWSHVRSIMTPHVGCANGCTKESIRADAIAGLTVATVIIPNAMGYALLIGLPPQAGLYATLAGTLFSVLWGSSVFVITGSVGIVSLLTLSALTPHAAAGTPAYALLAVVLALFVGLIQFSAGFFRLGFLARLIPHSVLIGFASGAALIIASTQIPALLGFRVVQHEHVIGTLANLFQNLTHTHFTTALLGLTILVFVFGVRRFFPKVPAALIALAASIMASFWFDFSSLGIATIGAIPAHLPTPSLPDFSIDTLADVFGAALIIAIVGFMETYAIGKALARSTREQISADQELVGQGCANMASGLIGGFPVSGSFSVSAVNLNAGARSGVSSIFAALSILLAILFLTPFLQYLPKAVLAAIIIAAVIRLVDFKKMKEAFLLSKTDGVIAVATFAFAFLLKPDDAVVIGIVLALLLLLSRIMFADVFELGFDHEWGDVLRRAGTKESIETIPGLLVVRVDQSILYANSERIVESMHSFVQKHRALGDVPRLFVINCAGVNEMDMTAVESLGDFFKELRAEGVAIGLIYAKCRVWDQVKRAHHEIGDVAFFHNIAEMRDFFDTLHPSREVVYTQAAPVSSISR